jgi:RNA polymerase sigma factor (sigma-70 family)
MTEKELIKGLKINKEEAYSALYDRFYASVKYYILRNSGSLQDAEDIFQETSIILLQKIREDKLELSASLKTYFYSIVRNLWLKKLRDTPKSLTLEGIEVSTFEESVMEQQEKEKEEENLTHWLHTVMIKLTGHCLMLMTKIYFVEKYVPVKYEELGYKNAHTYQNQKYKCLQQLKKAAQNNPIHG